MTTSALPDPDRVDAVLPQSSPSVPDSSDRQPHRLGVLTGLAALSLDAMASVAYGPEAIVLVLAVAGGAGLGLTVPVTASIAALLLVLTLSYRQVIRAFPQGGGAYGVARAHLGRRAGLVAGASLIIDYVLNVAVSVAAGVAALTSAVPALLPWTVELCLGVIVLVTLVNLRGIAESARAFIVPTAVYVLAILGVIVAGLARDTPAVDVSHTVAAAQGVGILLLLKAFANGCASLTGVEAIANAVPSFREPGVRRAQRAELALGVLLAVMLIGIATLIEKFSITPRDGVTVLAQVTQASLGDGGLFYVVQFATVALLALAANTSFGALPVLAQLLARDNHLPHVFALQSERHVHRYGIAFLAGTSAVLLVVSGGQTNLLVPLFAIGVFIGFTLSQAGMVRHWLASRPRGWQRLVLLNGVGAVLTGVAAIVVAVSKFTEGGWLVVVAVPLVVAAMRWVARSYAAIGRRLALGDIPAQPNPSETAVIVPVQAVSELTREALCAAVSLGDEVVAIHVVHPEAERKARWLAEDWANWRPGVELVQVHDSHHRLDRPIIDYLATAGHTARGARRTFVLIAEVEPDRPWQRFLQNQRGALLARSLRRSSDAVVCRMRFPVHPEWLAHERPRPVDVRGAGTGRARPDAPVS